MTEKPIQPISTAGQVNEFVRKLAEVLADDEQNDKVRIHHLKLAQRVLRWLQAEGRLLADERVANGRYKLLEKVSEWGPNGWQCPVCAGPTNSYGHGHEACREAA